MERIGFHLSVAGAVSNAAEEAKREGYGAFQLFLTGSRSWKSKPLGNEDIERFRGIIGETGSRPFAHMPYICNPSSPERETFGKGLALMEENLRRAELLGVEGVVTHMGSHKGKGIRYGIERVSEAIGAVLDSTERAEILLENGAGYANSVGSNFEEIGEIIRGISSPRVKLCLDTCHLFAAGYRLGTPADSAALLDGIGKAIGIRRLSLIHLNDSRYQLGSGLDRHWHIGKGAIGMEGFVSLFMVREFAESCMVLETPSSGEEDDRANLAAARKAILLAKARLKGDAR